MRHPSRSKKLKDFLNRVFHLNKTFENKHLTSKNACQMFFFLIFS